MSAQNNNLSFAAGVVQPDIVGPNADPFLGWRRSMNDEDWINWGARRELHQKISFRPN